MAASQPMAGNVLASLAESIGTDSVLVDEASRALYGQDISGDANTVTAVVRPSGIADLVETVLFAAAHEFVLVPRGGGMSYSGGYVCQRERTLCLDMAAMAEVLEVNTEDMYVTVQAGCTWKALHEALEPLGVRTPFWGTLSGLHATVGGSLSQNALFWGSGRHGCAADSVVGFEIVLADGRVLRTGAAARTGATPFFRHYGPDLTGLFTCDAGAFGIKATATLKLVPVAEARIGVSMTFADHGGLFRAMSEVSRQGLAEACFGFDPTLQAQRMKRESLARDVKTLGQTVVAQGGVLDKLRTGARVAAAGRRFLPEERYSAHFMIEERTRAAAADAAERIRRIGRDAGGDEVENTIPTVSRAHPFGPLNSMIGPSGERWLPVHGLVPHSRAIAAYDAILTLFERNGAACAEHGIVHGALFTYADTDCFVIEPVFYWPDRLTALHRCTVEAQVLRKTNDFPDNPAARAEVLWLRDEVIETLHAHGAVHLQIGRLYPFARDLAEPPRTLLQALKREIDPEDRVNPGALGL
ncbi:MAG: FAD-binding oxidoreductase [Gammaproteobacteria bacterium]|nr:FAD-binding oxidoreductase [Gammaproteobacteria bacterium]